SAVDDLADQARTARASEMDARLALRTAEERARAMAGRAENLLSAAAAERQAAARATAAREQRRREAEVARAAVSPAELTLARIETSLSASREERSVIEEQRAAHEKQLGDVRSRLRVLAAELEQLTDSVHRDEMARTEQRLRVQQLEERAADELGLD